MNRRTHLKTMAGVAGAVLIGGANKAFSNTTTTAASNFEDKVMTVTGPISPSELGLTLPHEHVFSIFGNPPVRYPFYPEEKLMSSVIPYLKKIKSLGVKSVVDGTAAYFGRHPEYLKQISEETGVNIITNTGYYAASGDKYVPKHAYSESVEKLANRWSSETINSIDGTEIFPGFIKTAIDDGPLSDIDAKLIQVAAQTHKNTGLAIQTHTGKNVEGAFKILEILKETNVHPSAWIWIHAHHVEQFEKLITAASQGAYISFDGLNEEITPHVLKMVDQLKSNGLIHRVLFSHDGNSFKKDGSKKDYHFLLEGFKNQFTKYGFSEDDFIRITEKNPAEVFTIKKRLI
jgi:predicted metal-dependent phosphotriesterase family hydrolase